MTTISMQRERNLLRLHGNITTGTTTEVLSKLCHSFCLGLSKRGLQALDDVFIIICQTFSISFMSWRVHQVKISLSL